MDIGDVIAIYAAVAATASIGWEVFKWRRSQATRVEVVPELGYTWGPLGNKNILTIHAINRSEYAVNVTGVGLRSQTNPRAMVHLTLKPHGATLPGPVEPRSSAMTYGDKAELEAEGFDFSRPVTAWVRLATNELIYSTARPLSSPRS